MTDITEDDWDWIKQGYMNGVEYLRGASAGHYEKIFDDFKQKCLQAIQYQQRAKDALELCHSVIDTGQAPREIVLQEILLSTLLTPEAKPC